MGLSFFAKFKINSFLTFSGMASKLSTIITAAFLAVFSFVRQALKAIQYLLFPENFQESYQCA